MTVYENTNNTIGQKVMIGLVVLSMVALVALFVTLTQPTWRGEAMAAEFKSDCSKRGGVFLIHHGTFGDTYNCASRLD